MSLHVAEKLRIKRSDVLREDRVLDECLSGRRGPISIMALLQRTRAALAEAEAKSISRGGLFSYIVGTPDS